MSLTITIPDALLETVKIPKRKIERELKIDLAFLMYEKEIIAMGTARRFSGMTKWEFLEGLSEKGIERHYHTKELEEDIKYAKSRS